MSEDSYVPVSEAIDGFKELYPRHIGGTRYRVLSLRNGAVTAHKVDIREFTCTCADYRYNVDDPVVCDHVACALEAAPRRVKVEENLVSDLSHILTDIDKAADKAVDAATEIDTALVGQRAVEADQAAVTGSAVSHERRKEMDDADSSEVGNPADPVAKAEELQEAFDNVVPDMKVEVSDDVIFFQTGQETPETLPGPGNVSVFDALMKNPEQVEFVHDDHELHDSKPSKWFKNALRPGHVDRYISEVLE